MCASFGLNVFWPNLALHCVNDALMQLPTVVPTAIHSNTKSNCRIWIILFCEVRNWITANVIFSLFVSSMMMCAVHRICFQRHHIDSATVVVCVVFFFFLAVLCSGQKSWIVDVGGVGQRTQRMMDSIWVKVSQVADTTHSADFPVYAVLLKIARESHARFVETTSNAITNLLVVVGDNR